jgi:hypothetical protein
VAALSTVGFAGSASASDYVSEKAVPGHEKQQRQGKVAVHYTEENLEDSGCDYVVNTLGDFGGDAYLNDGQMMNRVICEDGTVVTYHIYHQSHPAYDAERLEPIWGSWGYFATVNKAGRES